MQRASVLPDGQGGDDEDEIYGTSLESTLQSLGDLPVPGGDLTDLLRACLVALRLPAGTTAYQPRLPFWSAGEAAARIARLLGGFPDGAALEAFLPEIADCAPSRALRCRVAVAATFVAGLELTRSGTVGLGQAASWQSINVYQRASEAIDAA